MSIKAAFSALAAVGLAVGLANVVAVPAYAATLTVDTIADASEPPGSCTLRDAITSANTDIATGGCAAGNGADTIAFSVSGTIVLGSTLPVIASDITINDPLAGDIAISGNDAVRVFEIATGGALRITGLTVRDGFLSSASDGAGFRNYGTLDIVDSVITENVSSVSGGGIENRGALTVTGSTVTANTAVFSGGGIRTTIDGAVGPVTATVTGSTISGNSVVNGFSSGAGIFSDGGALIVSDSTFSANAAAGNAGAIRSGTGGTVDVSGSTFTGNTAGANGGALQVVSGTGEVSTSSFVGNTAAGDGGAIETSLGVPFTVVDSTFTQNRAAGRGGGLSATGNVSVISSTFTANRAASGGAISDPGFLGVVTVQNSTLVDNTADTAGAAAGIAVAGSTGGTVSGSILSGGISCTGIVVDDGYNIDSGATCGFTAPAGAGWGSNVAPLLGGLADNGGPTSTMLPQAGSPAIDAIAPGQIGCPATTPPASTDLATDQRGVTRPQGAGCDIGSVDTVASVVDPVYTVSPLARPLVALPATNVLKAGSRIPVQFTVTDDTGQPVADLSGDDVTVTVAIRSCSLVSGNFQIYVHVPGTALQSLGGGVYQYDLKSARNWKGGCGTLSVETIYDGASTVGVQFH